MDSPDSVCMMMPSMLGAYQQMKYGGQKGYAFEVFKNVATQLLEFQRPRSHGAVYTCTTQLNLIESLLKPYTAAATWMRWARTALAPDVKRAFSNQFPCKELEEYKEGMEDDWRHPIKAIDYSSLTDLDSLYQPMPISVETASAQGSDSVRLSTPAATELRVTVDGRVHNPHDAVVAKFWIYAARKFMRADSQARIKFLTLQQGVANGDSIVAATESVAEFASRVMAYAATLRHEFREEDGLHVFLNGLNDQLLKASLQNKVFATQDLEKRSISYWSIQAELQSNNRERAKLVSQLQSAAFSEVAPSEDQPDVTNHLHAACYLKPNFRHTSDESPEQFSELETGMEAVAVDAPIQSSQHVTKDDLQSCFADLAQTITSAFLAVRNGEPVAPAQSTPHWYDSASAYATRRRRPDYPTCGTCGVMHRPGSCYVEDPTLAPPGWQPSKKASHAVVELWKRNCAKTGVKVAAVVAHIGAFGGLGSVVSAMPAHPQPTTGPATTLTRGAIGAPPALPSLPQVPQDTQVYLPVFVGRDADVISTVQARNQLVYSAVLASDQVEVPVHVDSQPTSPPLENGEIPQAVFECHNISALQVTTASKHLIHQACFHESMLMKCDHEGDKQQLHEHNMQTPTLAYLKNQQPESGCVVITPDKRLIMCPKLLLDTGSTVAIMSSKFARQIGLHHKPCNQVQLQSVSSTNDAKVLSVTAPCELVFARNTEYQVSVCTTFLILDVVHGLYDILIGQQQFYKHAMYLDPLLKALVYRPRWQTHADAITIHSLPLTSFDVHSQMQSQQAITQLANTAVLVAGPVPAGEHVVKSGTFTAWAMHNVLRMWLMLLSFPAFVMRHIRVASLFLVMLVSCFIGTCATPHNPSVYHDISRAVPPMFQLPLEVQPTPWQLCAASGSV